MTDDEVPLYLSAPERAAWEAAQRARPEPWHYNPANRSIAGASGRMWLQAFAGVDATMDANGEFAALARTALPAALRALAEARALIVETAVRDNRDEVARGESILHVWCTLCGDSRGAAEHIEHEADCPLATMPRPK
jgi:hypothetical protein